jgi:AraC-like DNA-binding protein
VLSDRERDGVLFLELGRMQLCRGHHPAASGPSPAPQVLLPLAGTLCVRQGNLEQILRPPTELLYLPAGLGSLQTSAFHGWRLRLSAADLTAQLLWLSGQQIPRGRVQRWLAGVRSVSPAGGALLPQLLHLLEGQRGAPEGLLQAVGFEVLLLRLLGLLFWGEALHRPLQPEGGESLQASRSRILEELQAWIRAHLEAVITVDDLERVSGYSSRSLRNLFRDRCGVSPMAWIRQERLTTALGLLLDPRPGTTVSSVALAVGYQQLSQFSRDFLQLHGRRPSAVLRQALGDG